MTEVAFEDEASVKSAIAAVRNDADDTDWCVVASRVATAMVCFCLLCEFLAHYRCTVDGRSPCCYARRALVSYTDKKAKSFCLVGSGTGGVDAMKVRERRNVCMACGTLCVRAAGLAD